MSLNEWTGAAVEASAGDAPPSPDEWHPVTVPGRPERFADEDAVAYRTQFSDPTEGDERATLELRGLFADARIWLNGELLGEHDTYFVPARYQLDLDAENELVVVCRGPDRFGGVYATDDVPAEKAVPGIWWAADLEAHPETFIDDLTLSPRRTEDGTVIDARMAVEAGESVDERISLSVRPQGFRGGGVMERAHVEADEGERVVVEKELHLRDPAYWWPAGFGPQHQYAVRARLGDSEQVRKTGLCEVGYDDGLVVNGQHVPARGFGLLPTGDPTWDVERAANANANLVRPRAHVPSAEFYEACTDAGLLVWQDLPLSGEDDYDTDRASDLAETLAASVERHPSVAAFGVHDAPSEHLEGVGAGTLSRYKVRWRAWRADYDASADGEVAEAFDGAPVFPVSGAPGIDPDAVRAFPGWQYGDVSDLDWLLDKYDCGEVVGAFGAGALAEGSEDDGADVAGFDANLHASYVSGGVEESQRYQTKVLKSATETLRRRGTSVLTTAALRDTDAGAGMGVLTAEGSEKAGYAAMADSLEPVQVVLDAYPSKGANRELTVLNDSHERISGTVAWEAGNRSGGTDVTVEPFERVSAGTLRVPDDADAVELALSHGGETATNGYPL